MSNPLSKSTCGLLRRIVWSTPRQGVQSAAFILATLAAGLAQAHVEVPAQAPSPVTSSLLASDPASGTVTGTAGDTAGDKRLLEGWAAVEPAQLDAMRGGFDTGLRLTLSFGIERAVYLNGALVTTTSFNLPDMNAAAATGAAMATVSAPVLALVQNGPGNVFVPSGGNVPLAATVIQNTLSNQSIQSLTTINAAANSAQVLRNSAFQSAIRDGILAGAVPH